MELSHLQALFSEAKRLTGHSDFVVMGSLSILGIVQGDNVPARMLMSIDVDCYTRTDPGRILELKDALGEGSAFEAANGYYLDPVSPELPMLPDQWEARLVPRALEDGVRVFFLEPNDAAVSKYARGEPRDREWIRAGLEAGILSAPVIESRFRQTHFLDDAERDRALKGLGEDRAALERRSR